MTHSSIPSPAASTKKTYRILARETIYYETEIKAKSLEEAIAIEKTLIDYTRTGEDWNVCEIEEIDEG